MNKTPRGKGMKRLLAVLLVTAMLFSQTAAALAVSHGSMTREDITTVIEEVARRKNIPPDILKAIAWIESRKTQFTGAGAPFVSRGNRGLMQINSVHTNFDANRILNDVEYNIEAGADILLSKWLDPRTPVVGSRDPNILEHWYFALWAYNGWLSRNNPNLHGAGTYQDKVFELIRTRYGQEVSTVDWSYIPAGGLPPRDLHLPEPAVTHEGGILFFQPEDRAIVDARDELYVLKSPNGEVTFALKAGAEVVIRSEARLDQGLYWNEIFHPLTGQQGWAAGIYLKPVFVQQEASEDALWTMLLDPELPEPEEAEEVELLTDEGEMDEEISEDITADVSEETGEEASEEAAAAVTVPAMPAPPLYLDLAGHPAREAVETLAREGVFSTVDRKEFRPHQTLTRQEIAVILDKYFDFAGSGLTAEAHQQPLSAYQDGGTASTWAQASLARAAALGVIGGYPDGTIRPLEAATREQGIVMVTKAMKHQELLVDLCASKYFEDGSTINGWALSSVNTLLEMGIFEGLDDTSLNPRQELTRVELAVVLYRIHQLNAE